MICPAPLIWLALVWIPGTLVWIPGTLVWIPRTLHSLENSMIFFPLIFYLTSLFTPFKFPSIFLPRKDLQIDFNGHWMAIHPPSRGYFWKSGCGSDRAGMFWEGYGHRRCNCFVFGWVVASPCRLVRHGDSWNNGSADTMTMVISIFGCQMAKWMIWDLQLSNSSTVDGRIPANQLRLVVYPLIIYRPLYIPGGDRRISEPSTVSVNILYKYMIGYIGSSSK